MNSLDCNRALAGLLRSWGLILCVAGLAQGELIAQDDEDEEEHPWNVSIATRYQNRFTRLGVDLSQDQPALTMEGGLTHASGLSFGADAVVVFGSNGGYEQSSFRLGYERAITKIVSIAGMYTYHAFSSDTLSTLAGLSSEVTLGASIHVAPFVVSAFYNAYFGGGTANFITVGASSSHPVGRLTLDPELQMSFVSQTVDVSLLPQNRGNGKGQGKGLAKQQSASTTTTTITGLSNLTVQVTAGYPLGKGFVISLTPAYVYSPTDLAARTSQFLFSAAVTYSMDF